MCGFALLRVCGEGSICVRISRAVFCKTDVISEFAVSAKDCGEIFFCFLGFLVFEAFRVVQSARRA